MYSGGGMRKRCTNLTVNLGRHIEWRVSKRSFHILPASLGTCICVCVKPFDEEKKKLERSICYKSSFSLLTISYS